jgi:pyruvate dehydrogenase E2 component (dihydrolipoyllysine-residue acetyltransferase)
LISEVIMPDLGATGGDAVLEAWFAEIGQQIRTGQRLFTVTTDKATVDVEAYRDGVLREIRVMAGESVSLGGVVALISDSADEPLDKTGLRPAPDSGRGDISPQSGPMSTGSQEAGVRTRASPIARRLAAENGIKLETLSGSGRAGQILRRDVEAALDSQDPARTPPAGPLIRRELLTPMRKAIATRTAQSKGTVPHFYAGLTVDMAAARSFLNLVVERAETNGWTQPTINDLCLRATSLGLQRFPTINASFEEETILIYEEVNLGFVVGMDEGMLIPVIRAADRLNLYDLAVESSRLKASALAGRLRADEIGKASFTLSNLGMFGLEWFAAIINPPEAGILALGSIQDRPAIVQGETVARPLMDVTLSVDHRLVDGITAAKFLAFFKDVLEHPIDLALQGAGGGGS